MSQDSYAWLGAKEEVELHLKQAHDHIEAWKDIPYTVDVLKTQNSELKVTLTYANSTLSTHTI